MKDGISRSLPVLLRGGDARIRYFAVRDLQGLDPGPVEGLWNLPTATKILSKQLPAGSWTYPSAHAKRASRFQDYDQLETYRRLGQLVEQHSFDRTHQAIERAAEYMFGKQTDEGDFRGIYGRQYSPNYSAGITELLVKAGYGKDSRIGKAFRWLLSIRQDDGGWAIPLRTSKRQFRRRELHNAIRHPYALEPDPKAPSSWLVTGVVLRAFAAHSDYGASPDARRAADLLSSKFFERDAYIDRGSPEYWGRVAFPFWFTDLVSSLDSLSSLKPAPLRNEATSRALEWLMNRQGRSGLFELKLLKTGDHTLKFWVTLAICRILRRYGAGTG